MSKIIAACALALSLAAPSYADTKVYRLELTDDVPFIVGVDGVRRQVVLVDPDEYEMLTGRLEKVWSSLNSTEDGRIKIHGMRQRQYVEGEEKFTVYKDGYIFSERMVLHNARPRVITSKRENPKKKAERINKLISDRQEEYRKERDRVLRGVPKEVTVEHDATTGKDIVK